MKPTRIGCIGYDFFGFQPLNASWMLAALQIPKSLAIEVDKLNNNHYHAECICTE
jgi:hypothetical protein